MDKAYCAECGYELKPAPARWDGEPTFVGYLPCPNHPHTTVRYEKLGIIRNTIPAWFTNLCEELKKC